MSRRILLSLLLSSLFAMGACKTTIQDGRFLCVRGEPGTCPDGWDCRADPESKAFHCYSSPSPVCGDGVVDDATELAALDLQGQPEDCDGWVTTASLSCEAEGFAGGSVLLCGTDCRVNPIFCQKSLCGNTVLDQWTGPNGPLTEECDGTKVTQTCADLGAKGQGAPACGMDCRLDPSTCPALDTCGNGIQEGTEACDGTDLGSATCESLGFSGGGTLHCNANCTFNRADCLPTDCGNGIAEDAQEPSFYEQCDGSDLRGQSCESMGLSGGTLACTSTCRFDLSGCTASPTCGNGILDRFEQCDGSNLRNLRCEHFGFVAGGDLSCNDNCTLDFSGCL